MNRGKHITSYQRRVVGVEREMREFTNYKSTKLAILDIGFLSPIPFAFPPLRHLPPPHHPLLRHDLWSDKEWWGMVRRVERRRKESHKGVVCGSVQGRGKTLKTQGMGGKGRESGRGRGSRGKRRKFRTCILVLCVVCSIHSVISFVNLLRQPVMTRSILSVVSFCNSALLNKCWLASVVSLLSALVTERLEGSKNIVKIWIAKRGKREDAKLAFHSSQKQGRIHGNQVADGWAGAVMQKPLQV